MPESRRSLLSTIVGAFISISLAGCIGNNKPNVNEICNGDCEYIENVSLDSSGGFGGYTDIIIQFTEQLESIELTIEIQKNEQVVAIRSLQEQDTSGVTIEFDNHKTSNLSDVDVTIHSVELKS